MLKGKKIILGVTGSIAAYKAVFLLRELVKAGADVQVVITPAAKEFVAPLTFATLSKKEALCEFSTPGGNWNNHVALANNADLIIVAPASANTISKYALGICDNLLLAVLYSASCPVFIAPAMDREMYSHPSIRENMEKLKKNKIIFVPPGKGELASGLIGEGRMAEPNEIIEILQTAISHQTSAISPSLKGITAMVTAGPTQESIDPVRFISNHSSGKMGFAIAEELAARGATVTLIHGPVSIPVPNSNIKTIAVTTAEEMNHACMTAFPASQVTVMAAAVADYKPANPSPIKIKKTSSPLSLPLEPVKDILAQLGEKKKKNQLLIGFALETDHAKENALKKMLHKNLDAVILNSLKDKGAGPGGDTNRITILGSNNKTLNFELKTKVALAGDIVNYIESCIKK
jgi:phosphopantothenoylcysteine decarboxylase/phosphopantothenate--cysteine ligase